MYVRRAYIAYEVNCLQHRELNGDMSMVEFKFLLPRSHPNRWRYIYLRLQKKWFFKNIYMNLKILSVWRSKVWLYNVDSTIVWFWQDDGDALRQSRQDVGDGWLWRPHRPAGWAAHLSEDGHHGLLQLHGGVWNVSLVHLFFWFIPFIVLKSFKKHRGLDGSVCLICLWYCQSSIICITSLIWNGQSRTDMNEI